MSARAARRSWIAGMIVGAVAFPAAGAWAERAPRPADLVILQERQTMQGPEWIGVFGVVVDPEQAGMRRVRIWQETLDTTTTSTDVIHCSSKAPMRITGDGSGTKRRVIVRELNPGGLVTAANRLDHKIWWATCVPGQAGRDPAELGVVARQLGYNGNLSEREQVLVAPP